MLEQYLDSVLIVIYRNVRFENMETFSVQETDKLYYEKIRLETSEKRRGSATI